jgi:CRISPR/Cas system-associated exonuclease Cas4 (RecB family)
MIPQTSHSSASSYLICPKQYAYAASAALPAFSSSLHMGSALHATIKQTLEAATRKNGELFFLDEIASIYKSKLRELPTATHLPTPEDIDEMLYTGIPKLETFLKHLAPKLLQMSQLELEKWIRLYLNDQDGAVLVTGRIDLTFYDPSNDTYFVYDLKMGKVSESAANHNPQLALYVSAIGYQVGQSAKIRAFNIYFEDGVMIEVEYEHQQHAQKDLAALMQTARDSSNAQEFPINRGYHCVWCSYQTPCFTDNPPSTLESQGKPCI